MSLNRAIYTSMWLIWVISMIAAVRLATSHRQCACIVLTWFFGYWFGHLRGTVLTLRTEKKDAPPPGKKRL